MLLTKANTLLQDGIDPLVQGKENFKRQLPKVEQLAKERAETCKDCRYFKKEPIPFFRVTDNNIPELSGMSCGRCGCVLSYKLRQSTKPCARWQKDKA